jgi:hypothetical protein
MRPVFSTTWRTAADAKSVHDHLSRHHASSINERARFDISLRASPYLPAGQIEPSLPCASVRRIPPRAAVRWTGRATRMPGPDLASLVTPRNHISPRYQDDQSMTDRNVCDDVSANKSLNGNERETPRYAPAHRGSRLRIRRGARDRAGAEPSGGIVRGRDRDGGGPENRSCSDMGARNRTRMADVSLGTDDATRGRPPVPGATR